MVLSPVFQKNPIQNFSCPRDLQESDFLDLLRSSVPQLAAGEPFDLFITDTSRKLHPLRVSALTPEEIYRTIRTSGNSALYVRLKVSTPNPLPLIQQNIRLVLDQLGLSSVLEFTGIILRDFKVRQEFPGIETQLCCSESLR